MVLGRSDVAYDSSSKRPVRLGRVVEHYLTTKPLVRPLVPGGNMPHHVDSQVGIRAKGV